MKKEAQIYGYPREDVPRLCLFTIKLFKFLKLNFLE